MNSNSAVAWMLVIALAVSQASWARGQEHGGGHANPNAGANANANAGLNENAGAVINGNPGDLVNGNAGGAANGSPSGAQQSDAPIPPGQSSNAIEELSESDVLEAVEAGRTVSLSTILPDIRARTGGEMINAQLQQAGGFLLYAVTVLTPTGKVATEYYYARSGLHVGD